MNNPFRASRGFTTIELMVVVSIIAILSAIVLTAMSGSRAKSRDAQRVSDLHQLQLALALFFDRCGQYPTGSSLTLTSSASPCSTYNPVINLNTFLAQLPTPPSGGNYDYTRYISGGRNVNYVLHTDLEAPNAATAKGLSASSIPDSSGTWSLQANQPPFSDCSNSAASLDYCIGPN